MDKKKILISAIILFVSLCIGLIIYFIMPKSYIKFNVAPKQVTVLIDGGRQTINNGDTVTVKPGSHKIEISQTGFDTYTTNTSADNGKTSSVDAVLKPLTDAAGELLKDPSIQDVIEINTIKNRDADLNQRLSKYPILQYLPYTEPTSGNAYTIDAQITGNNLDYLSIHFNTCSPGSIDIYKTEALNWIRSKNANPDDYVIKYSNLCD